MEFDQRRQALLDQHLIAYATFTDERQSFYYTEPALEVLTDGTPGGPGTAAVLSRRLPEGVGRDGLAAIYAKVTQRAVEQLRFEYPGWGDIPMILPRAPGWTGADQVRLEELRRQVLAAGDNERRRQELITEGRRLQIGFNRLTEMGRTAAGRTQWEIIEMEPGEVITRVAASYAPGSIKRLSLRTDRRTLPLLTSGTLSGDVFSLSLPDYARHEGVEIGRDAEGRLQSIGLVFSREPVPAADRPLLALTQGLWTPEDSCPPRLADEKAHEAGHARPLTGIARLHGLYTTPTVGRFFFDPDRQQVNLYLDHVRFNLPFDDQGSCGEPQPGNRFVDRMGFARQTHAGANPNQLIDTAVPPQVGLAIKDEGTVVAPYRPLATGPLVRAPRPRATDTDKIAWGGTFALPHRPPNVRSNFVGYDITQLDPHNFLRSHGLKQLVFDYPADDSTDYQTTDNSLIVPRGVYFKSDVSAVEDAHTVMVAGAFEYKYAWSMSIGLNLGFGLDGISAAFSANASYGKRSQTRQERQVITSITRTAEVRYALIADRTRIELSPAFRDRVLALRDDHLVDQISDASVGALIKRFGTHYPYAVTYGGMAFLETDYSEQVVGHMTGTSRSFEEQSSVSFANESKSNGCGCAGGGSPGSASFGVDTSVEDDRELSTEVQNSVDSHIFGTYGGSATRGEGWSLSPGQEVPLFFDLRPLHELLSPIFFDDPIVWEVLAPALERETRAHLRRAIDADRDAKPGWYDTNRENELRRHEPRVFDHAYKAAQ